MPTTIEALVIIALVLSPGYVFTQLARRVIAHIEESTDVRFLLTIITAGTAIQALLFPWTLRLLEFYLAGTLREHPWESFTWAVVAIFFLPLALGFLAGRLALRPGVERGLDLIGLGYVDRMPSAWDYVIRQRQSYYVRIHLKDNQGMIGGVFADRSFGSLNPRRADVYLQETWRIDADGAFVEALEETDGVWISHDVMAYALLFKGSDEERGRPGRRIARSEAADPEAGHRQARRPADRNRQAVPAGVGIAESERLPPTTEAADPEAGHRQARRPADRAGRIVPAPSKPAHPREERVGRQRRS